MIERRLSETDSVTRCVVPDKKEPVSSGVCLTEIAGSKLCVVRALCALVRFGIQTPFVDEKSSIKSIEKRSVIARATVELYTPSSHQDQNWKSPKV